MRHLRIALFVGGFMASLAIGLGTIYRILEASEIEPLVTRLEVASFYRGIVESYEFRGQRSDPYRIAFLGDSMIVSYPDELQIARLLESDLRRRSTSKRSIQVVNLGIEATGIFDYYFMADVISELEPQLIIVEFNLVSTAQTFRSSFSRPELAGWIAPRRMVASLGLPLNWVGLTFDKLLLYVGVVRAGGFETWKSAAEQQTRVGASRRRVEDAVAIRNKKNKSPEDDFRLIREFRGLARNNLPKDKRFTEIAMREQLGPVLVGLVEDDPSLEVLGATVRTFQDRGIATLVYINPINIDHLTRLGLSNEEGLARSLAHLERAVTESGGVFLDLHDIFPDEAFRDRAGHLAYDGTINGPGRLAAALAPAVMQERKEYGLDRR
jgi:hypothetical protein